MADTLCTKCRNQECEYAGRKVWVMICAHEYVAPPMTRADHIRAMTDEELAEMFLTHDEQLCRHCPSDTLAEYCQVKPGVECCDCKACWLDWLRQEAEADAKLD